jgi:serine/threonine-protein kinase
MGTVFLALDRKHQRRVAIKVLPPDLAAAIGPDRFLREIEIAARLSHPHVVSVYDSGQAAGCLYFVMPLVEGESLAARLAREGPLPVADALKIAAEIADSLAYAHDQGVIHRDVTPGNVLLAGYPPSEPGREWHALLADFGVAKALAGSSGTTTDSGLAVGTRGYSSPEQASGSRELDGRTDIYSLGCVLFEMVVGPSAGAPSGRRELLENRFADPLPAPSSIRAEIPRSIDLLVERATAIALSARFPTAVDFHRAILAAGGPYSPPGFWRRHRRLALAGAALVALVGAGFTISRRSPKVDPKQVLIAPFENRTGKTDLDPIGDMATDYLARGLAATHLMSAVYDARAEDTSRGARAAGPVSTRALARRLGAGTAVFGRYYLTRDSLHVEAQILDAASGRILLSLDPVAGRIADASDVVEHLRQRVMAGLGTIFGPGFEPWEAQSVPPTYEAYRYLLDGGAALWTFKWEEAIALYRRAAAVDTGYPGAKAALAYALSWTKQCREIDSLARVIEPARGRLSPLDEGNLRWAISDCRQDDEGRLEAARLVLARAPRSVVFTILAAIAASELARPREALAILQRLDPRRAALGRPQLGLYWDFAAMAHAQLGDFRGQLEAARAGLRMVPREAHFQVQEALARSSLGQPREAERLALGLLAEERTDSFSPGELATCIWLSLRRPDHAEAGAELLARILAWYGDRLIDAARANNFPCVWHTLSVHYYARDTARALSGYRQLAARDTGSVLARAGLGALALRRGDRALANEMEQWLLAHPGSESSLARARMAALAGNRDRAVELLSEAFRGRLRGRWLARVDPDFDSLADYPPFQELFRPKG